MLQTRNLVATLFLQALFAMLTCAAKASAQNDVLKILFVGNSHTLSYNMPERVQSLLHDRAKGDLKFLIRIVAKSGWNLARHIRGQRIRSTVKGRDWDLIILQEATTAFLSERGRRQFDRAVTWFNNHKPDSATMVLYQTWPYRRDHALYAGRQPWGRWFQPPDDPQHMFGMIQEGYAKVARRHGLIVAPVGTCWFNAPDRTSYFSPDAYHANPMGAEFVARVLARALQHVVDEGPTGLEMNCKDVMAEPTREMAQRTF